MNKIVVLPLYSHCFYMRYRTCDYAVPWVFDSNTRIFSDVTRPLIRSPIKILSGRRNLIPLKTLYERAWLLRKNVKEAIYRKSEGIT